ncbi:MAG: insulinase family protein, partial [Gemmatimonadota bacterium]
MSRATRSAAAAVAAVASALVPAAAGAQAFVRERPPALGAPAPLTVPAVHTQRLANGITLSVVEQRELPLVQVIASFAGGSRLDGVAPGIASFTANMLDEGAGPRD